MGQMNGYLLDSNIAIAILLNEPSVIEFVQHAARDKRKIYFSVITECEVLPGLKDNEHLQAVKLFGSDRCIQVSSEIAQIAGSIRRSQREKGRKLKTPDALIIATAKHYNLALVSRDHDMHFVQDEYDISLSRL
jgi:tRNA(fMet)-specific endonuclease VapC